MLFAEIDTETTGLPSDPDARVVEVGVAVFEIGAPTPWSGNVPSCEVVGQFASLVRPEILRDEHLDLVERISGISRDEVLDADPPEVVWLRLLRELDGAMMPFFAWNLAFDATMMARTFAWADGLSWRGCTMRSFATRTGGRAWKLSTAAEHLGLAFEGQTHRALADAIMAGRIQAMLLSDDPRLPRGSVDVPAEKLLAGEDQVNTSSLEAIVSTSPRRLLHLGTRS
jgi:DNA polymerase III epsilon subunit-like protein